MTRYVALLHGIGPGDPNMTSAKFKAFFGSLGYKNVATVIDMREGETPSFMVDLERKHGKALTTRTWKTVGRIMRNMDAPRT